MFLSLSSSFVALLLPVFGSINTPLSERGEFGFKSCVSATSFSVLLLEHRLYLTVFDATFVEVELFASKLGLLILLLLLDLFRQLATSLGLWTTCEVNLVPLLMSFGVDGDF